jgi:thiamine biosynthesis lipoprotein
MTMALLTLLLAPVLAPATETSPAAVPSSTAAPAASPETHLLSDARPVGTAVLRVSVVTPDEALAHATLQRIVAEVERVDAQLSEARSSSETSLVNRAAGGAPAVVSPELVGLLVRSRELSGLTQGAFALTAGVLTPLWPFDAPASLQRAPDRASLEAAVAKVGDDRLGLDVERHAVTLPAGARIELRHMLRGYSLTRALAAIADLRVVGALVALGGAVAVRGDKEGKPWIVGIQDPRGSGYFAVLPVASEAVVTRGDYERWFMPPGGKRYHDVLDPHTGLPAGGCRSVTIVSPDAVLADVLASAVMVLGAEEGLRLVDQSPGAGAVLVTAVNEVVVSQGLKDRVRVLRPPTD